MSINLILKGLRVPKFAPDSEIIEGEVAETRCFLPVEIVGSYDPEALARLIRGLST